ncbi:hypothetical protein TNCT_612831 [Trichonephila clavata]|uniref:Uncharacterized protein n=1 Tax=Trichonephila clavata TaxID=2740835 RepID=A0A8X6L6T4_TRICU|nr:hypothetical protein TNCT_612831 [Trichonephila clavata]
MNTLVERSLSGVGGDATFCAWSLEVAASSDLGLFSMIKRMFISQFQMREVGAEFVFSVERRKNVRKATISVRLDLSASKKFTFGSVDHLLKCAKVTEIQMWKSPIVTPFFLLLLINDLK